MLGKPGHLNAQVIKVYAKDRQTEGMELESNLNQALAAIKSGYYLNAYSP